MKPYFKRKSLIRKRLFLSTGLFGLTILLLMLSSRVHGFADWYSDTVYIAIAEFGSHIFGIVPFSVSELLLYVFILIFLWKAVHFIYNKSKLDFFRFASGCILTASILLFIYVSNCGINYHKTSFSEKTGIHLEEYSIEQLSEVCMYLTDSVNTYADLVKRDEYGVMVHCGNVQQSARNAMENLSSEYPMLAGYYPKPKYLFFPWILSVQKITGIYSPFTVEANYNNAVTDYNVPFSACHELSHLRGYMQEEEANFIAYLACVKSDEIDFRYSGSLRGWISCMNMLYRLDSENWTAIRENLHPAAEADLKANRVFWDTYDGKIAEYAEKVNDQYLKANGQIDGVQSYGRMADLIVSYYCA